MDPIKAFANKKKAFSESIFEYHNLSKVDKVGFFRTSLRGKAYSTTKSKQVEEFVCLDRKL